MPYSKWTAAAALSLAVLAQPTEANACSCSLPEVTLLPNGSAPPNTKLWIVGQDECLLPILSDGNGNEVSFERADLGRRLSVLTPNEQLVDGATYRLRCDDNPIAQATTFTVSGDADTSAPPVPAVDVGDVESSGGDGSSCGESETAELSVDHDGNIVVLDIAGLTTLDPEAMSGDVLDAFTGNGHYIGNPTCMPINWSFDEDGDATGVRVATFDLAGNFSGWSDGQEVDGGCSVSARPAKGKAGFGVLFLLGFAVGLRRKRHAG
jgi:MYXO-CTERM domain-containing protein